MGHGAPADTAPLDEALDMFRATPAQAVSPAIDEMVRELLEEDRKRVQVERRSLHREPFVRPAIVVLSDAPCFRLSGFTRNISSRGVGVVLDGALPEGISVRLFIHRFQRPPTGVICGCRWCDEYGNGWYAVGMNFLRTATAEEMMIEP
jgi:hypothetical protein